MPFSRFVQTGRVAVVQDGPLTGKLVSIVDVIDQTRVLIDGPSSGVPRQPIRINQLHLTKFRIRFSYRDPTRLVRKAWEVAKIDEKWAGSLWAKKIADKEKRVQMNDFDRFKLKMARRKRNNIRTATFKCLRENALRAGVFGKKRIPKAPRRVRAPHIAKRTEKKTKKPADTEAPKK